jgi:hypothetical protein
MARAVEYKYEAICFRKCYWLDTLWDIGEVYAGDIPPNKHFNETGKPDAELPPMDAGMDPRPTKELKAMLEALNFKIPTSWSRKRIWKKLVDLEIAIEKDELTNPSEASKTPPRGKSRKVTDGDTG